jgi:hypothetical protein
VSRRAGKGFDHMRVFDAAAEALPGFVRHPEFML